MHSISVWWAHMEVSSQVFWGIALFGTVVLAMQVISMFLGLENMGGHDADTSSDSAEGHDTESDSDQAHQGFDGRSQIFHSEKHDSFRLHVWMARACLLGIWRFKDMGMYWIFSDWLLLNDRYGHFHEGNLQHASFRKH